MKVWEGRCNITKDTVYYKSLVLIFTFWTPSPGNVCLFALLGVNPLPLHTNHRLSKARSCIVERSHHGNWMPCVSLSSMAVCISCLHGMRGIRKISFSLVPQQLNHLLCEAMLHDTCTSKTSRVLTVASLQRLKMEALLPAPANCEVQSMIKFSNAQSRATIKIHCQSCAMSMASHDSLVNTFPARVHLGDV